jgi:hypothetical protein
MARKHHKPEEIVAKLRQVDVLVSQGQAVADAIRAIGVSEVTYYRWRQEFGSLKSDQMRRLKDLVGLWQGFGAHLFGRELLAIDGTTTQIEVSSCDTSKPTNRVIQPSPMCKPLSDRARITAPWKLQAPDRDYPMSTHGITAYEHFLNGSW